ncbi:YcaO-like family protein [Natrialbaceae archaeon AArc-T1-2]|uniref:YcaO-like family protein n=1 Tax=Natrialbaceae archaeon AArc-T1-2 TaxID=3053904 RepID=UPI00255A9ACC|nr:YcaO-like family protein [Natrialbaceae archaeon AArc-T1-2]WIV68158.1 YcaO-like family protein [Natrialbaceae archaeon AArc-T1-2]
MDVHVVAEDPIREAVVAALSDVDVTVRDADPADVENARFAVVSDVAGAESIRSANDAALAGNTPWIAVEIGGVGGHPLADVDAAISGFAPKTGCFDCLDARVGANATALAEKPSTDRSTARLAGAIAGRECVRLFSGEEPSIVGHVLELPHTRRRVLSVPGCSCDDADRDRSLERDDDDVDLETAVERAEAAIDDRVGIVRSIGELESFPAPYYLATNAETEGFSDASAPTQAAGVDADWNAALMKAVGEALERYCAGVYREDDFVHASADDLASVVSPTDLVRPDNALEFDPAAEYRWVDGENLATGETTHVPAAAVQFPQPGEGLVPAITTGLGLGSSTVDALRSGLTEVLERDATMLAWYSTYEPLALETDDEGVTTLTKRARSEGLSVTPLLVTQDVDVPVVAVAVHREGEWPRFAAGSAADLDVAAAARSALAEALQNWMELRSIGPDDAADAGAAIGAYAEFPEPARSFVDVERSIDADAVGPDTVPTGRDALEELIERTDAAGLTPYATRLTTRDVSRLGFEAVRVVVPGAQPLFTDEPYFGERARTVPPELGFEPRLERAFHPYP